VLRSNLHQRFPRLRFRVRRLTRRFRRYLCSHYSFGERTCCDAGPGYTYEFATIHFKVLLAAASHNVIRLLISWESLWDDLGCEAISNFELL
jgi:hypothetical protein